MKTRCIKKKIRMIGATAIVDAAIKMLKSVMPCEL